jgi:hypothetical protein
MDFEEGSLVAVLTDGSQHLAICEVRVPQNDVAGKPTIQDEDDLYDIRDKKVLGVKDKFGSIVRVMVSKGAGILLDTGEWCVTNMAPGLGKITHFVERFEIISPGFSSLIDHNGVTTSAKYVWRTLVNKAAMMKDLDHNQGIFSDIVGEALPDAPALEDTLEINIDGTNTNDVVTIQLKSPVLAGESVVDINLGRTGSVEVKTPPLIGSIKLDSTNVLLGDPESTSVSPLFDNVALEKLVRAEITRVIEDYRFHNHTVILPLIPAGAGPTAPGSHISIPPSNQLLHPLGASHVKAK